MLVNLSLIQLFYLIILSSLKIEITFILTENSTYGPFSKLIVWTAPPKREYKHSMKIPTECFRRQI